MDEEDEDDHGPPSHQPPAATITTDDEWAAWLRDELRSTPAYAEHAALLEECAGIAAGWRARFWADRQLWSRIRHGHRLAKELCEAAPVLARARDEVAALTLPAADKKLVVLDLCSGFGYLAMFLSELLPADKVEKIVLVDLKWPPHGVAPKAHHLSDAHLVASGWPIRLTTSRADLKCASDRRNLARAFLSGGAPAMLLGVHLCGVLSLRAVQLFNDAPALVHLALKPCRSTGQTRRLCGSSDPTERP